MKQLPLMLVSNPFEPFRFISIVRLPSDSCASESDFYIFSLLPAGFRGSPRKLNLVAELVRGVHVPEALIQMELSDKKMSEPVRFPCRWCSILMGWKVH